MWSSSNGRGPLLLALAAILALGSAAAQLAAVRRPAHPAAPAFQTATGGLGLGSSVSSDWSFHLFDPRVEGSCENELWPLPGLPCPNPCHGAALANLPRLD